MRSRARPYDVPDLKVHLTYQSEVDGREVELPFVVGVIGAFRGERDDAREPVYEREFEDVSERGVDVLLARWKPQVSVAVPDRAGGGTQAVALRFAGLKDFQPEALIRQVPALADDHRTRDILVDLRDRLMTAAGPRRMAYGAGTLADDTVSEDDAALVEILATAVDAARAAPPRTPEYRETIDRAADGILAGIGDLSVRTVMEAIDLDVAEIDAALSRRCDAILHDPGFQRLEALWRGVDLLVRRGDSDPLVIVKVLDLTREELEQDLSTHIAPDDFQRAAVLDSTLFRIIYSEEFGQFGGHPFGLILLDEYITPAATDVRLAERLATIGEAAHCPVIAAAAPEMFGIPAYSDRDWGHGDLRSLFGEARYAEWRALRQNPVSRYLGLVLPRFLLRDPYRSGGRQTMPFDFEEQVADGDGLLWGNGAFAFALTVVSAFARYRWCTAITGLEGGGAVSGLVAPDYGTDEGAHVFRRATERVISTRHERDLAVAGFIPLVQRPGQAEPVFCSAFSVNLPSGRLGMDPMSERLSARLPYMFAASRIAHYVKANMRERIGGQASMSRLQSNVSRWISQYVAYQDDVDDEVKAERPLRDARVTVLPSEDEPGRFTFRMEVQPHFQLEEMGINLVVGRRAESVEDNQDGH